MRLRRGVRIVGFVGVGQHSIGQCRLDRAAYNFRGNYGRDLFSTIGASEFERGAPGCQVRTRNHRRQSVQDVLLRFLGDLIGQRAAAGFAHVSAELVRDQAHALPIRITAGRRFGHHGPRRNRGSCNSQARKFEQAAPGKNCAAVLCRPVFASLIFHAFPFLESSAMASTCSNVGDETMSQPKS